MTTGRPRSNWKLALSRAATASTLCGLVAAPLLTSVSHAAPLLPPPAPAPNTYRPTNPDYGRDGRDDGDYPDRDGRDNDGRDNDDQDNPDDLTVTATVTRAPNGDSFQVREDGTNRTYTVDAERGDADDLNVGDQVELRGDFANGRFEARSVRQIDDADTPDQDNADQRTLTGVVTRDLVGRRFAMRAEDGRTYEIRTNFDEPTRLLRGDRVRVSGSFDEVFNTNNPVFVADNLRILGNNGPGNGYGTRAFLGTVVRDYPDGHFTLRLRDGTILRVEAADNADLADYEQGDTVRVNGTLRNNVIFADDLQVIGNGGTLPLPPAPGNAQRVIWTERITGFTDATHARFYVRHNNVTYTIDAPNAPDDLEIDDMVRITALLTPNSRTLRASQVTFIDEDTDTNANPPAPPQAVSFKATVNRILNDNTVEVRGDNGQVYTISYLYARNFRNGDHIRVRGTYRAGTVYATGVDRL